MYPSRRLLFGIACFAALPMHQGSLLAQSQTKPPYIHNLGVFHGPDGPVRVFIVQSYVRALFEEEATCPYGGKKTFYLQGTASQTPQLIPFRSFQFSGDITLCTDHKELLEECNLESVWKTSFEATYSNPYTIRLKYDGEHYPRDDDGDFICNPQKDVKTVKLKRPGMWKDLLEENISKAKDKLRDVGQATPKSKEIVDEARDLFNDIWDPMGLRH